MADPQHHQELELAPGRLPVFRPALLDAQGRTISYLRLSLTDRCNFQCSYCSPLALDHHEDSLTRPEVARLTAIFAGLGVRRVRLTGGEPTLRKDLVEIVRDVASTPGIEEVALTTNGQALAALAAPLRAAGAARVNISLDTLRPERLLALSGRAASLDRITAGIAAAGAAGFLSVKLNVVVVRGVNDDELDALARFGWRHGAIVRFIELMPFGRGEPVPLSEVRERLVAGGLRLEPDATRGWGPAKHLRAFGDGAPAEGGLLGFIGAMTENFCEGCNRVRVAADGSLRACLGGRAQVSLKGLLRDGTGDQAIGAAITEALGQKHERHEMGAPGSKLLPMIGTGG
jgi:cyclic pyranopterin phosphate synthase